MNHVHVWRAGLKATEAESNRTLIVLHGTGGDENSLVPLAKGLDREASILSVRGNVLEGTAPRFFRRLAEGVFDHEDLVRRTHELADFIEEASARYGFEKSSAIAVGYSNGANIAASMLLLRPEVLCGAILIRSMVPLEPQTLPNLVGKHVLMLAGEYDSILPVENAQRLEAMFRTYGADITFELLRAGHELTGRDVELAQNWLAALPQ